MQTVDRRYTGGPEGFSAALPRFVDAAITGHHFPMARYEKEIEYLSNLVHTCSEITPEAAMRLPPVNFTEAQKFSYSESDLKYAPCVSTIIAPAEFTLVSDIVGRHYDRERERGIVFKLKPVGDLGYRSGRGFNISVMFTAFKPEPRPPSYLRSPREVLDLYYSTQLYAADVSLPGGVNKYDDLFERFGIICASIQGPGQKLGTPGTCSAPIPHGAPSHSLDDTFARTVEIVNENASKGIQDALASSIKTFSKLQVCYSITMRCEPTDDDVRVPGDLDVASDFWDTLGRRCGPMSHVNQIEVAVKGARQVGRKKYILCTTALELARRRERLRQAGASN